ncbi:MAG: toprim domain-containing protein [Acetobacter fabarum]|uniref:DUF7146 domain-containing protein n=1 Tax=Acetobacter fabarum TaxID=483199 RepID=UPI0039E7A1A9
MRRPNASELARLLADHITRLAPELLPHGKKDGAEWRVGSLAGEPGQSLAVRLTGARRGLWCDFSSGERGDSLDLVASVLFNGDRRSAMAWTGTWLGLSNNAPHAPVQRPPVQEKLNSPELDREAQQRRAKARRLWQDAAPGIAGSPVEHYLQGRGIDLRLLGRAPGALRFHPTVWCAEVQRPLPAMLGAICGPTGKMAAVHRTWLAQAPSGAWGKAELANAKKVLGSFAGGCIRLWRGASGAALGMAPDGDVTILAEGIETALSCAIACPEYRVLASVSLSNMAAVKLPDTITEIIVAADNDAGNPAARKALKAALHQFAQQGRTVRLAVPEIQGQDWNNVLTHNDKHKGPQWS